MAKHTGKKIRGIANPERNAAMIGKRSSNAAGIHLDGRMRRARTRAASLRRDLRDVA